MRFHPGCCASVLLLIMLLPTCRLRAQAADATPGLPVGTQAPDFSLPDQQGREQELAELLKKGKVALVFYRSASW